MLKFLLILGLILYVIYKIGNLFFRAGAASQQFRNQQPPQQPRSNTSSTRKSQFKGGGEYIDYEEIK